MSSPLVSVIIPARNAEKTIGNAIASVLEQTMPHLELIVVDDASTDRTAAVVSAVHDSRLRFIKSDKNIRYAAARNLGLRNARGKWAAFLDADDEWTPERLESLLRAAQGKENCYVTDLEILAIPDPAGRLVRARAPRQVEDGSAVDMDLDTALTLGHDVRPMIPVSAFRRDGVEFPEWGSCGEWTYLIARLSSHGIQGRLVRRAGYLYRAQAEHDSSTSAAREELLNVLEILLAAALLPDTSKRLLLKKLEWVQEGLLAAALRHGHFGDFFAYARQYPRAVLNLPYRALLFATAKVRSFLATSHALKVGFTSPLRRMQLQLAQKISRDREVSLPEEAPTEIVK